ncbi:uncharacterized protein B0I36DRAFT_379633 [Microdochium trichocladiopsis]|uniref:Uncharacterized protein n=1 Tax=Microdochium trichocladiopsis TaxID=1682393 RepID=A0A9P8YHP8_9PEZI|nr:uncharacterized protein B0I36DRAFT_379633 [Microdochium trichocladiopsis]KAH7040716.1 hypothetical protein B0I36DRAFT_379633 [Microdochium trichocladiopsis]
MASHKYTSAELLELRDSATRATSESAVGKIARNPEFASLLNNSFASYSRRSRSTKEDTATSTDSDEQILFKGKKSTHITNDSSGWQYRGRAGSDLTVGGPISAPAGLVAQQSEGFKRFYKAVVSPSHVRVTAGGRIVPNTRPSTSPTAKWDKESSTAECGDQSGQSIPNHKQSINGAAHPVMVAPSMYGQFLFPQMMAPMPSPVPLYHLANGFPMAYGNVSMPNLAGHSATQAMPSQGTRRLDSTSDVASQDGLNDGDRSVRKDRPPPILVLPTENREAGRPFVYQGQLVYPRTPFPGFMPSPYVPGPGLGRHPFLPPGFVHMAHTASAPPIPTPAGPYVVPSDGQPANVGNNATHQTLPTRPIATPPLSSIKPSSVTRRQLESLHSSLKYYEDQLAYNKHQIDEQGTQEQARKIRRSIAQFEQNLKLQEEFEAINYPKQTSEPEPSFSITGDDSQMSQRHQGSRSVRMSGSEPHAGSFSSIDADNKYLLRQPKSADLLSHRFDRLKSGHVRGMNSIRMGDDQRSSSDALDVMSATLPSDAALAQPFSPDVGLPYAEIPAQLQQHRVEPDHQLSQAHPYLVGSVSHTSAKPSERSFYSEYNYPRELTPDEKRAREVYWGNGQTKGMGLPKFDGKDFYPPSPVKFSSLANTTFNGEFKAANGTKGTQEARSENTVPVVSQLFADAPATSRHRANRKLSHAIPIVAPADMTSRSGEDAMKLRALRTSTSDSQATSLPPRHSQHVLDRPSNRSTNDLWHSMMRNGSTGGNVTPGTITSATAKGYLPQYSGHASASLMPSVPNVSPLGPSSSGDKPVESEIPDSAFERTGENCPPNSVQSSAI